MEQGRDTCAAQWAVYFHSHYRAHHMASGVERLSTQGTERRGTGRDKMDGKRQDGTAKSAMGREAGVVSHVKEQ